MATPPFNISTTTPGDSDIVSQFPANERTNRDQLNSWLLTEHNANGYHNFLTMPVGAAPATPAVGFKRLYVDANGNLAFLDGAGLVYYIGASPGTVEFTASATIPNGWVAANGQQIGRFSNGVALFAAIGTAYGVGDGSLTFNVPNIAGRVIAGSGGAGVLDATGGMNGTGIGSTGGVQVKALISSDVPAGVPSSATNSITVGAPKNIAGTTGSISSQPSPSTGGNPVPASTASDWAATNSFNGTNNISVVSTNAGQTSVKIIQPTIVLTAIIKL